MELKDIKDSKNWSFSELTNAICEREKEIAKLEDDVKKLREVKLQKTFDEIKPQILEGKIDLSLDDLQQFLQTKFADVELAKTKNKSSRKKKISDDDKKIDNEVFSSKNNLQEDNGVVENLNVTEKNSQSDSENQNATQSLNLPPDENSFEDAAEKKFANQNNQSVASEREAIARNLGLAGNATLEEIKTAFEKVKKDLPPAWCEAYQKTIQKIEVSL